MNILARPNCESERPLARVSPINISLECLGINILDQPSQQRLRVGNITRRNNAPFNPTILKRIPKLVLVGVADELIFGIDNVTCDFMQDITEVTIKRRLGYILVVGDMRQINHRADVGGCAGAAKLYSETTLAVERGQFLNERGQPLFDLITLVHNTPLLN